MSALVQIIRERIYNYYLLYIIMLMIILAARYGCRHTQVLLMCLSFFCCYAVRVTTSVTLEAMTNANSANPDFEVRVIMIIKIASCADSKRSEPFSCRRSLTGTNQSNRWSSVPSSGATPAHKYLLVSLPSDGAPKDCSRQPLSSPVCWPSAVRSPLITVAGKRWSLPE